jgi:hypothetical protein
MGAFVSILSCVSGLVGYSTVTDRELDCRISVPGKEGGRGTDGIVKQTIRTPSRSLGV